MSGKWQKLCRGLIFAFVVVVAFGFLTAVWHGG